MEITIHSGQHHSCSNIENQCSSPLIHKYIFEHQAENLPSKCVFHWFFQPTSLLGFHLGELKALTSCSGKSAPVGSCLHSQWWSGAGPCWLCTWKILDGGFLHSSFWPWPSGSHYAALRSMQCLSCCNIPVMVPEGHFHLSRYNRALKSFLCASGLHMTIFTWRSFLYSSSVYSCHLFLISSAFVQSIPFLPFIVSIFAWNVPLVSLILWRDL